MKMQLQFLVLSSSFEFHCREQLLNLTFPKTRKKNRLDIFLLQQTQNSLAMLLFEHVFTWKLYQTVVKHGFHILQSYRKGNYGQHVQHGQHKLVVWLHPKFTSRRRFQSMFFFFSCKLQL